MKTCIIGLAFFISLFFCNCYNYDHSNYKFDNNLIDTCTYRIIQKGKKSAFVLKNNRDIPEKLKLDEKASIKCAFDVEKNIEKKYGEYYNKYYKQFFFFKNPRNNDTIATIWFLNDKEIRLNPSWICEQPEIGKSKFRNASKKHPNLVYFNFTKKEFSTSDAIFY